MSRIGERFAQLRAQGRTGLIPYVTGGDPSPRATVPLMHALAAAGADVIELGVPFSDPMADGPVIQRASDRAIRHGVSLQDCLNFVADFRRTDAATPIVLMGYANPIERMGVERFAQLASDAGVDGVIVVDYPPEECADFAQRLRARAIDPIFLLAPTSTEQRIDQIAGIASGYVYYVSLTGITGAGHLDVASVAERIPAIRARVRLPVGVGFGIKDAASARAVGRVADAVVIGSRVIQAMEDAAGQGSGENAAVDAASAFVASIRAALDADPGASAERAKSGGKPQ
jgi:tryptophan synthase alpha chain